ncbi:hypothetical protein Peur_010557 [Populus x canadensis]
MPRSMRMATLLTNLWATKPTFGCTKQRRGFGRYDYKNGYFQGAKEAPLEAASGCPGGLWQRIVSRLCWGSFGRLSNWC